MGFFDNAQEVLDRGVSAAKGAVSGVAVEQQAFRRKVRSSGRRGRARDGMRATAATRRTGLRRRTASSRSFFYDNQLVGAARRAGRQPGR